MRRKIAGSFIPSVCLKTARGCGSRLGAGLGKNLVTYLVENHGAIVREESGAPNLHLHKPILTSDKSRTLHRQFLLRFWRKWY